MVNYTLTNEFWTWLIIVREEEIPFVLVLIDWYFFSLLYLFWQKNILINKKCASKSTKDNPIGVENIFHHFFMPSIFPIIYAIINIITATTITNIDVAITNNNINTDTIILSTTLHTISGIVATANSIAATLPLHHLLCHHEYPLPPHHTTITTTTTTIILLLLLSFLCKIFIIFHASQMIKECFQDNFQF